MKKISCLILSILFTVSAFPQEYKVTTDQTDSFSVALVKLLNAAPAEFKEHKGELLQYTIMQEHIHQLNIPFPGSTVAVIRSRFARDFDAYVEFRPYNNTTELEKGMRALAGKIKKALGPRLDIDHDLLSGPGKKFFISSFGLKDRNGYFTPNIELLTGRSSETYMLKKDFQEKTPGKPDQYFILLKVKGRTPDYQYKIPDGLQPPDKNLHRALQKLINDARTDFRSLEKRKDTLLLKKKRGTDTLQLYGQTVYLSYYGENYTASIMLPAPPDSLAFKQLWDYCHQVVKAAADKGMVYHLSKRIEDPLIVYYRRNSDKTSPTIYLQTNNGYEKTQSIIIKVMSRHHHAVPRVHTREDY